jgi:hypothetical protein
VSLFREERLLFIGGRGSTGGVQWRPAHHACRLWEGQGRALVRSGHVQRHWGDVGDVMARQGDEGEREEQWPEVGGSGLLSSLPPSLKAGVWAGETGGRQRRVQGTAWRSETRTRAANHCCKQLLQFCLISAQNVFDEMPARNKNSNFRNFQIGLVIILDGDSETIFFRSRGGVLLHGYFEFGVVICFRFKL